MPQNLHHHAAETHTHSLSDSESPWHSAKTARCRLVRTLLLFTLGQCSSATVFKHRCSPIFHTIWPHRRSGELGSVVTIYLLTHASVVSQCSILLVLHPAHTLHWGRLSASLSAVIDGADCQDWSKDGQWLAIGTRKCTVHVFLMVERQILLVIC